MKGFLWLIPLVLLLLASCQTVPSAEVTSLTAEKASLEAQLNDLKARALELEREIDAQRSGKGALTETRDQLLRDRDTLLARTGRLETRIAELETEIATVRAEKALALNRAADPAERITSLESRLAALQTERDALAGRLQQESERLEAAARQLRETLSVEVGRGDLEIVRYQNVLVVNIKDSLLFAPDSPVLKADYKPLLATITKAFDQFPEKVIRVEGHTAVAPSRWSSSWDLGAARAVSVVRYLQEEQRVDPSRLVALSFGEFRPLAPNGDEAGRAMNRRVELVLVERPLYQVQELIRSTPR